MQVAIHAWIARTPRLIGDMIMPYGKAMLSPEHQRPSR